MANFRFFKMAAVRHAAVRHAAVRHVAFLKLRFQMFSFRRSADARHPVKFRQNRSNGCRDIAIFRFSKMAAAAILDF